MNGDTTHESSTALALVDKHDGYAVVTLNDPDRRNVFTLDMSARVEQIFDDLEADESISAVILTGAGRAFCSGGHLDDLLENPGPDGMRRIYSGFVRIANSPLATIAAVNGAAVGAGMNSLLACDVVVAGESAKFDSRFLQIGLGPGGGHTWRLNNSIGLQATKALVLFGEVLDGRRAAEIGLAWSCVPDDELLDAASALAVRAANAPRELLKATKQTIHNTLAITTSEDAIDNEIDTQVWSMSQPAFVDLVSALKSKISDK